MPERASSYIADDGDDGTPMPDERAPGKPQALPADEAGGMPRAGRGQRRPSRKRRVGCGLALAVVCCVALLYIAGPRALLEAAVARALGLSPHLYSAAAPGPNCDPFWVYWQGMASNPAVTCADTVHSTHLTTPPEGCSNCTPGQASIRYGGLGRLGLPDSYVIQFTFDHLSTDADFTVVASTDSGPSTCTYELSVGDGPAGRTYDTFITCGAEHLLQRRLTSLREDQPHTFAVEVHNGSVSLLVDDQFAGEFPQEQALQIDSITMTLRSTSGQRAHVDLFDLIIAHL